MNFSISHLGKALSDLTYNDIVHYFKVPRQESESLEFKSFAERATFDSGLQNVIRGISAFLNSSGGLLIWGAPKGTKLEGYSEDVFVGDLFPVKELVEKDRLINKISSAIVPLPVGVNVKVLTSDLNYIYIFEVQQSQYKPHQYDARYYVRLDGQSRPAPHYLVEALIKKVSYPNLNGVIKFGTLQRPMEGEQLLTLTIGLFNFSEFQNEEMVSFRLLCVGGYFRASRGQYQGRFKHRYSMKGAELIFEDFASVLHFGTPNVHDEIIVIDSAQLRKNNGELMLLLSFGGKCSPAKTSTYVLDLNNRLTDNPNSLIKHMEESVLVSEYQKRLNKTSSDTLKSFLGR